MHTHYQALLEKEKYDFNDLRHVMEILRGENGCPWDREQGHADIRSCLIEETYEVAEAIDTENSELMCEELGDLLFQIMFHSRIEEEEGRFSVDEVIHGITHKMIARHPHVFGQVQVENSDEVLKNWDAIKTEEKQRLTLADKLHAIPPMLPALMRAAKVAKKSGIAAEDTENALSLGITSALSRLENAAGREELLGEILMLATRLCMYYGMDAEHILQKNTEKVIDSVEKKQKLSKKQ